MTKIKICGMTNLEDARGAVDLGADLLGFNFYSKSPRFVDAEEAKRIIQQLDGKAETVGVFVNEQAAEVKRISDYCGFDLIQLSGNESLQYVDKLRKLTDKKIIKSFRMRDGLDIDSMNFFDSDFILADSFKKGLHGGTGTSFDLGLIKSLDSERLFLAGGLNQLNVKAAIKKINPFAVDACSSIESYFGKKDFVKMKGFIEAAR